MISESATGNEQPKISNQELETYTKRQLALRNGQDRDEIWVAYHACGGAATTTSTGPART